MVRQAVARAVTRVEERRGAPCPNASPPWSGDDWKRSLTAWLELEKGREPFEVIQPESEREARWAESASR